MSRRPYLLVLGVAIFMGTTAVVASIFLGERLVDPDGFLGPAWVRLPAMVAGAFLIDVVPRALWRARGRVRDMPARGRELVHEHWSRDRVAAVVIGLASFYVTYVSYRNLKNYLPRMYENTQDKLLHDFDRWLMFGHEPAVVLHNLLGDGLTAHVLAFVYLLYLPLAPLSLVAWLVWSRSIPNAYWYATANCLTWSLGTLSYYLIPTLGPAFEYVWLYRELPRTGVTELQDGLWLSRSNALWNPFAGSIQSVAGFASLHVALTLTIALIAHYTIANRVLRWTLWVYFWLTALSTTYFGWHYIADDLGGALIAFLAVWLGARATGQRLQRQYVDRGGATSADDGGGQPPSAGRSERALQK